MFMLTKVRNAVLGAVYRAVLKPIFFRYDPEQVHDRMTRVGALLGRSAFGRAATRALFSFSHPSLDQTVAGLRFANPVGLAAGFDKDALLTDILPEVGFGFAEVGSVTGEPCAGNSGQRLWRLPKSRSLVVYYGLKNRGCEEVSSRLRGRTFRFPLGVSVAKTNSPDTVGEAAGISDYLKTYRTFLEAKVGDYVTVNISCPNAYGGEPFTEPGKLGRLLAALSAVPKRVPVFLKLPAELPKEQTDEIVEISGRYGVDGFVCTNLAKSRQNGNIKEADVPKVGGLSGKVVENLSNDLLSYLYPKVRGRFVLVGVGGIFSAEDAYKKIRRGASLVQLITGMIYRGPQLISEINVGLAELLRRDGFGNISEAIGADYR